jgi:hypothetical protein
MIMHSNHRFPCKRLYGSCTRKVTIFLMQSILIFGMNCLSLNLMAQSDTSRLTQPQLNEPQWTHFRGNRLDGIADERQVPVSWNDSTHVQWKTEVPGRGWSSPVVLGNQIWLTTEEEKEMRALCFDWNTGEVILDRVVFHPDTLYGKHAVNTYATPTAAIEEGFVYVHFGRYGTACLNSLTGEKVWERTCMGTS